MEGVLCYDAGAADSPGSMSSSASKVDAEEYVGVSGDVVSGTQAASANDMEETDEVSVKDEESSEEDLELGLSLGTKTVIAGAGTGERKPGAQWTQRCRILTAKDFPSLLSSRASPRSSSTSSVSSSAGANPSGRVAGTKRATADSVSPDAAGGTHHSPCQVVVGWPPIRAFRMNNLFNQSKDHNSEGETVAAKKANHHGNGEKNNDLKAIIESQDRDINGKAIPRSSLFVKVNMDGDPIGRKVDIAIHHSYETLAIMLEDMFGFNSSIRLMCPVAEGGKASKLLDGSSEFALTYEDKDGDWMMVGDVPWGMFLDTVKRLRIMRTADANGLGPRLQSSSKARPMRSKPS